MMMSGSQKLCRWALAAAAFLLVSEPAFAEKRVALVLGNSNYQNVAPLANPVNDSAKIASTLKDAGFDVVDSRRDLPAAETRRALRDFADRARDADIAVVYYAGHGIEVDGTNVSPSIVLPNTGDYQSYQSTRLAGLKLEAGRHVLRVVFDTDGFNLNWLRFSLPSCTDLLRNGSETDVDCGGTCPAKCNESKACSAHSDCQSGICVSGACQSARALGTGGVGSTGGAGPSGGSSSAGSSSAGSSSAGAGSAGASPSGGAGQLGGAGSVGGAGPIGLAGGAGPATPQGGNVGQPLSGGAEGCSIGSLRSTESALALPLVAGFGVILTSRRRRRGRSDSSN